MPKWSRKLCSGLHSGWRNTSAYGFHIWRGRRRKKHGVGKAYRQSSLHVCFAAFHLASPFHHLAIETNKTFHPLSVSLCDCIRHSEGAPFSRRLSSGRECMPSESDCIIHSIGIRETMKTKCKTKCWEEKKSKNCFFLFVSLVATWKWRHSAEVFRRLRRFGCHDVLFFDRRKRNEFRG